MKKVFFDLLLGFVCVVPCMAQDAQQNVNDVASKTAEQVVDLPRPSGDQVILLIPTAPVPNSTVLPLSIPTVPGAETALLPTAPPNQKSRSAHTKKSDPLKGNTTGNKTVDAFIIASAARNNLDPILLYSVMRQESAFNPRAISPKGARGLMQLIPATASRFGVRNIYNPQQNIEAGARYLRFLLDTFKGDVSLALAGYNAGEGTVKRYSGQVPPFQETIKYVSRIRQHYETISNPPPSEPKLPGGKS